MSDIADAFPGQIATTQRLRLRVVTEDDAPVHLALVNDPVFIEFIGDRKQRTLEDARRALADGPVAMLARHGHAMYIVELHDSTPIGFCGLLKREALDYVDLGYAFLPAWRGQGYALEAAQAAVRHAMALGITPLAAICNPANAASIGLLLKLGFRFARNVELEAGRPLNLYLIDLGGEPAHDG
jgi:RimJ/RimL family protein N-acetyltransferase